MNTKRVVSFAAAVLVAAVLARTMRVVEAVPGPDCAAAQAVPLTPADPALCARLDAVIRRPGALPLGEYEARLGDYLRNFCYRNEAAGWTRDKYVRDTGPFTASLNGSTWTGAYRGTHAPVLIWYSPEMFAWLRDNRPDDGRPRPTVPAPIPDGAVMVKEMYPPPAAACASVDPMRLLPTSGAAVMVRDAKVSHDGWFWGWFGWSGWAPDWPAPAQNSYPNMGFGQYCVNCHASAADGLTFASLRNIKDRPGTPLVFLSQHFFDVPVEATHHRLVSLATDDAPRLGVPRYTADAAFLRAIRATSLLARSWDTVPKMPSETYDNAWARVAGPPAANEFLTSDQCIGCHDAGSTGLQFDMTTPNPHATPGGTGPAASLLNLSPFATWRTSPMGLAGRDPIFYAQLASETETFHPTKAALVETTCLGCHGVLGQRQHAIDTVAAGCEAFPSSTAMAVPWPAGNPTARDARNGALARDGISCLACHRMVVNQSAADRASTQPENRCVQQRQALLNPTNTGFARTFTGSFMVGPPAEIYGPFDAPKTRPMETALGITPKHNEDIKSSELCGTCHTVHLPVFHRGNVLRHTYEQTTYAEWAFSAYRTGTTPNGPLPSGAGAKAESCQGCHMPGRNRATGVPYRSKIASIQEHSNFPEVDNGLGPADIDLPVREGFARHTLVGLNVFLVKMFQQFPDVLGIRTQDPMLVSRGVDPLLLTEQAMLDQASHDTATIAIDKVAAANGTLEATVKVTNETGHRFPSGVGFRRAFLEFSVLDANGAVLWASGRTNEAGVIVDESGTPVAGELWWADDCSARLNPGRLDYQPHYDVVTSQQQAQIYQELVTAPANVASPVCGATPTPGGAFTTSFLSICANVKDNRLLPHGFLPAGDRVAIAKALGAGAELADEAGPHAVGNDPDYRSGGGDSVVYRVDLSKVRGRPAAVKATLYYQATPPYFLQDRFCTSTSDATARLAFLASHVNLNGTEAENWKLAVVTTGPVPLR